MPEPRSPFESSLDLDARRLVEDWRLALGTEPLKKLGLLRRLEAKYVECSLPMGLTETQVEQSFNEQLFASVLDYTTLFSHDGAPFNLLPKNYSGGKYDDFSLGFFGAGTDRIVASAELKGPRCDLDRPQMGRKEKLTPVQQALAAASGVPGCRWVIVSNFRELRLYDMTKPHQQVASVDLLEVRDPRQLAFLTAHFDRRALLGDNGIGELMSVSDPGHPATPVAPKQDAYRVVATFTPARLVAAVPLSRLYDALRPLAVEPLKMATASGPYERREAWKNVSLDVKEGWCLLRSAARSFAVSSVGQVRYSLRRERRDSGSQIHPDVEFWSLVDDLVTFFLATREVYGRCWDRTAVDGLVSVSVREIDNWSMYFDGKDGLLQSDYHQNGGVALDRDINVGPFHWGLGAAPEAVVATIVAEVGLHFADTEVGDRLRFDGEKLAEMLRSHFSPTT